MKRITLDRIPQKRIRELIAEQMKNNVKSIADLKASHQEGDSLHKYLKHELYFDVAADEEKVWKHYLTTNPAKIWNGKMVSFGLMLSKQSNEIMYVDEPYHQAEVGQVYFINLKILNGLHQLAVSHELVKINEEEKYIELSYIEGGKSIGVQRIQIKGVGEKQSKISHISYYRSKSNFRDRFLYPYFHTKVLKEYHLNMIKHILAH